MSAPPPIASPRDGRAHRELLGFCGFDEHPVAFGHDHGSRGNGSASVCVSKVAWWTSTCELKCLIETAQALEAGIGSDLSDGIVRDDEKPLCMANAVPGEEIGDGGAECLAE